MVKIKLPNKRTLTKHIPKLLAGASIIGNGVAAYLFAERSFELGQKADHVSKKEAVQKLVLPTVLYLGSSACTILLCKNSVAAISSLTAANAYISERFANYRAKTKELYGADADSDIIDRIETDSARRSILDKNLDSFYENRTDDVVLFWSPWHKDYFETDISNINDVFYFAEQNGFLYLNQLFDFLGWPQLEDYDMMGWDEIDGVKWSEFEVHNKPVLDRFGKPVDIYFLYFPHEPFASYPMEN